MATTSPDNLRTPNPGDAYNLTTDLATLASDVQGALNTRANVYRGSVGQRVAFTAAAQDGVLWQETSGDRELYAKNTPLNTWVKVNTTSSADLTTDLLVAFRGTISAYRSGNVVYMYISASGTIPTGITTIGTIRAGWRPPQQASGVAIMPAGVFGAMGVGANGVINVINSTGASRTLANASFTFLLP